jgi:hypothetical protein
MVHIELGPLSRVAEMLTGGYRPPQTHPPQVPGGRCGGDALGPPRVVAAAPRWPRVEAFARMIRRRPARRLRWRTTTARSTIASVTRRSRVLAIVRRTNGLATVLQPPVERLAHDLADIGPEQPGAIRSPPCSSAERVELIGAQREGGLDESAVERRVRAIRPTRGIGAICTRRGLPPHAHAPANLSLEEWRVATRGRAGDRPRGC